MRAKLFGAAAVCRATCRSGGLIPHVMRTCQSGSIVGFGNVGKDCVIAWPFSFGIVGDVVVVVVHLRPHSFLLLCRRFLVSFVRFLKLHRNFLTCQVGCEVINAAGLLSSLVSRRLLSCSSIMTPRTFFAQKSASDEHGARARICLVLICVRKLPPPIQND